MMIQKYDSEMMRELGARYAAYRNDLYLSGRFWAWIGQAGSRRAAPE
jgi:hypothetical protein